MDASTVSHPEAPPRCPSRRDTLDARVIDRTFVATRQSIAGLLLDRAGYTTDKPLSSLCALDPGCGDGVIVGEMVRRMVQAAGGRAGVTVDGLLPAIRAIELDAARLARTRRRLLEILSEAGFDQRDAHRLVATWCVHGDLLGDGLDGPFDVIAGNPPYLSYAHTPEAVRRELRARFKCYRGRADLYVACIERCLDLLGPDGRLAAITPNRWLKREYGRPLQELVQLRFSLDLLIDAETAELFEQPVQAYPVIAVIRRGSPARTVNVSLKGSDASKFASVMTREAGPGRLNAFGGPRAWLLSIATFQDGAAADHYEDGLVRAGI